MTMSRNHPVANRSHVARRAGRNAAWCRPGNPKHLKMTKFWRKPFLIRFAMAGGATSGSGSMITTGAIGSDDD